MTDDLRVAIATATKGVTKKWKQAKRSADRNDRVSASKVRMLRYAPPRVTIREVAFRVMEDAYNKASANGKYHANARQIMYAARPEILAECDAVEFNDVYFTQTLLKDYIEDYAPDWNVVWDARGNLIEPHTNERVALGGIGVKNYMDNWCSEIVEETPEIQERIDTKGPINRFSSVLFIEKEGFTEILTHAGIGKRFDMAIMSTKGLPVAAACDLIEAMADQGVRVFVLHDFDLAGFKIVRTLKRGTRLSQGTDVIDLGLRLADVDGLSSEPVSYRQDKHPSYYLRSCGATAEEIDFLVSSGWPGSWSGERVEINAMTSDQLIAWLEQKFSEHDVKKVIPEPARLKEAYQRAVFLKRMEQKIEEIEDEIKDDEFAVPKRLAARVKTMLKKRPTLSWDDAIWQIAEDAEDSEGAL